MVRRRLDTSMPERKGLLDEVDELHERRKKKKPAKKKADLDLDEVW